MYASPLRDALLPSNRNNGADSSFHPRFSLSPNESAAETVSPPTSNVCLKPLMGYQQGDETYYIASQWLGQTDAAVSNLQHSSLTNRKLIHNIDYKFSRTKELSFENSRYHNYMADSDTNANSTENVSSFKKSTDVNNVRQILKENVKQYTKVVNTLPAGDNKNDLSGAMFRQMAASCGIHVEDPKSFSDSFDMQQPDNELTNEILPNKITTVTLQKTKNSYENKLLDIEPEMQSMKLEYSAIEVVSKNSMMDAWKPEWMNSGLSNKANPSPDTQYNIMPHHSQINGCSSACQNSIGFETCIEKANALKSENADCITVGQFDLVGQNICFPGNKDYPRRITNLPVEITSDVTSEQLELDSLSSKINSMSTQTEVVEPVYKSSGQTVTSNKGNQISVLMMDAAVNVNLCGCADKGKTSSAKEISTQTELPFISSGQEKSIKQWIPPADIDINKPFIADQNSNTGLFNGYGDQFCVKSNLQQTPKSQFRDAANYPEYNSFADVPIFNTPPQSPENINCDVSYARNTFWNNNNNRPTESPCFQEQNLQNLNEVKLDFNLYCLVLEKLKQQYPALNKAPQELQLLAKTQTLALQVQRSQMHYSFPDEPRAITKTVGAPKEMEANKFFHNLSTTVSSERDLDYVTPDDSTTNNSATRRYSDTPDFRCLLNPPYRKFQNLPFSPKVDYYSKPVLPEISSKISQMDWGSVGFSPIKYEVTDSEKCDDLDNLNSSNAIMKKAVEKSTWNSPVMSPSVIAKANLRYQSPNSKDCLAVTPNEFHGNNFQQAFKRKKRLQFAMEQTKRNVNAKIDANIRKGNYERLVQVMQERLPNTDRTKVDDLIREVRRRKNGLGGLTMREIVLEAKSILQEKNKIFANVVNTDSQCALCVEDLKLKAQKQLDCGHNFHEECIMAWVHRHERSCPTCGQLVLFPEEFPKLS
ncbi:DZIP3 ligase [Octopus vulgaris]|nr:DZIP3 ligase [Octopus vulgaris]